MGVDIKEVVKSVEEYLFSLNWVHPSEITGFDPEALFRTNKSRHDAPIDLDEEAEGSVDELIFEYLVDVARFAFHENKAPTITWAMYLDAVLFLVVRCGSTRAGHLWRMAEDYLKGLPEQTHAQQIIGQYQRAQEFFVKETLRELLVDMFEYGELYGHPKAPYHAFDTDTQRAIKAVYERNDQDLPPFPPKLKT